MQETLKYLKNKNVVIIEKKDFINNIIEYKTAPIIEDGKFWKIKDNNGSHIISRNMLYKVILLTTSKFKLN